MGKTIIRIEDMEIRMFLGIHDFEKETAQRVLISVDMIFDEPLKGDGSFFDYDKVVEFIRQFNGQKIETQEELIVRIKDHIAALGCHDTVIYTRKPDIFQDCGSVGVILAS